jgi:hypothetical protein
MTSNMNAHSIAGTSACWDEIFAVFLLLVPVLMESRNTSDDTNSHEANGNNAPAHTPASGRAAVALSKDASVRAIDLTKDKVIALLVVSMDR